MSRNADEADEAAEEARGDASSERDSGGSTAENTFPSADSPDWCLEVDAEAIRHGVTERLEPAERHVVWTPEYREKRGKWTKPPMQPDDPDEYAKTDDPTTWSDDETALGVATDRATFGFGTLMLGADAVGYLDIDFKRDGPLDPETATPDDLPGWIPDLTPFEGDAYMDLSPSDAGLRIVAENIERPDWWINSSDGDGEDGREVQVTESGKYATLTGRTFDGFETAGAVDPDAFEAWLKDVWRFFRPDEGEPWHGQESASSASSAATNTADGDEGKTPDVDADAVGDALGRLEADRPRDPTPREVVAATGVAADYPRDGDRSEHDWAICKEFATHGVRRAAAEAWFREALPGSKVAKRGIGYGDNAKGTWAKAVAAADAEQGVATRTVATLTDDLGETDHRSVRRPPEYDDPDSTDEEAATALRWRAVRSLYREGRGSVGTGNVYAGRLLAETLHLRTPRDALGVRRPRTYRYDPDRGYHRDDGYGYIGEVLSDRLGTHYNTSREREARSVAQRISAVDRDEIGGTPGHLVVANGVLDLTDEAWLSGERDHPPKLDHDPEAVHTRGLPWTFDPDATAPKTDEFTEWLIRDGDREKAWEYAGYTLCWWGMPYKRLCVAVGPGDSGKSTWTRLLRAMLTDENISAETLQGVAGGDRWAPHSLVNAMANIRNELPTEEVKDPARVKELSGGEEALDVEDKGQPKFTAVPTAKFVFSANELPDVRHDDDVFYDRFVFVSFPFSIHEDDQQDEYAQTLIDEEASGILNKMLDGYRRLRTQGRFTNERSAQAKREYWRSYGSPTERFVHDCITRTPDPDAFVPKDDAYAAFIAYCHKEGLGTGGSGKGSLTRTLEQSDGVSHGQSRRARSRVNPGTDVPRGYRGVLLNEHGEACLKRHLRGGSEESDTPTGDATEANNRLDRFTHGSEEQRDD